MKKLLSIASFCMTAFGSLADCEAYASMFDNTCTSTSTPVDMATHVGKEVSCTGEMRCPGSSSLTLYTDGNPCTWNRKLCVTCSEDIDGKVSVRV